MAEAFKITIPTGFPTAASVEASPNKSDLVPFYRYCADQAMELLINPDAMAAMERVYGCSFEDWCERYHQTDAYKRSMARAAM